MAGGGTRQAAVSVTMLIRIALFIGYISCIPSRCHCCAVNSIFISIGVLSLCLASIGAPTQSWPVNHLRLHPMHGKCAGPHHRAVPGLVRAAAIVATRGAPSQTYPWSGDRHSSCPPLAIQDAGRLLLQWLRLLWPQRSTLDRPHHLVQHI